MAKKKKDEPTAEEAREYLKQFGLSQLEIRRLRFINGRCSEAELCVDIQNKCELHRYDSKQFFANIDELYPARKDITETFLDMMDEDAGIDFGEWHVDASGVWRDDGHMKGDEWISKKTIAATSAVIPVADVENVDTHKHKTQLAYISGYKILHSIEDRSTLATANKAVLLLSDKGIEITSNTARAFVDYINNVRTANAGVLPHKLSKSVLGWTDDGKFLPYDGKLVFDGADDARPIYEAVTQRGGINPWIDYIRPLRQNLNLRLCMAASFASPLIKWTDDLPFVFHMWGGTGAGKTLALMVAMSIWGNPEAGKLVRSMNSTINATRAIAATLNNIPFAGNELQTIKNDRNFQNYDQLIYELCEAQDKSKMVSGTEIQAVRNWECTFLFNGEEPITKANSGAGAKNRTIEIECKESLFPNIAGNEVASFVKRHYGEAGKIYIQNITDRISEIKELRNMCYEWMTDKSNIDTSDKQAAAISMIYAADTLASNLFFEGEEKLSFETLAAYVKTTAEVDASERAFQFVIDSIAAGEINFEPGARERWGIIEGNKVYFIGSQLRKLLSSQGYDFTAIRQRWADKGHIEKYTGNDGFSKVKSIGNTKTRCVCINKPDVKE